MRNELPSSTTWPTISRKENYNSIFIINIDEKN